MVRRTSVDEWIQVKCTDEPDGSWNTILSRVAAFHHQHSFSAQGNNGHDMGYRIALTIEELGELSSAITKGKPPEEAAEELADLLIIILGHSLAMEVDLEKEFHMKMDKIMNRDAKMGNLGIRITDYEVTRN